VLTGVILTLGVCVACEQAGGNPFGHPFFGPKSWKSDAGAPPAPASDDTAAPVTPKMIKRIEPQYPPSALNGEIEGRVVVRFQIAPDGAPFNVAIESSDNTVFNSEVMYALRNSRFAAEKPGLPLYAGRWYRQPYAFKLESDAAPVPAP
jgi:TonB family protein